MTTNASDGLALFGGDALFDQPRPIGQLDAPPVEAYLAELREILARRRLSNDGPLLQELEERLAKLHRVEHVVALANAALGLTMLIQRFAGDKHGEVVMPAFSYRGLPHFARWAGQTPRFCDVDPGHHGLDPASVRQSINAQTTSVLAVCNYNSPGSLSELGDIARVNGLPLIIDSVYAQGATHGGAPMGGHGDAEVYSLHATKLLNGFEGGYVTTNDEQLARQLRWQRCFTLAAQRPDDMQLPRHMWGINAKLNELHAAMALLSLDQLDDVIRRNEERHQRYAEGLAGMTCMRLLPGTNEPGERRNFSLAVLEILPDSPLDRDQLLALIRAEGAVVNPYYSPALHRSEHCPKNLQVPTLPVAESLAMKLLQLPVGHHVSLEDIDRLTEKMRMIDRLADEIARRMSGRHSV